MDGGGENAAGPIEGEAAPADEKGDRHAQAGGCPHGPGRVRAEGLEGDGGGEMAWAVDLGRRGETEGRGMAAEGAGTPQRAGQGGRSGRLMEALAQESLLEGAQDGEDPVMGDEEEIGREARGEARGRLRVEAEVPAEIDMVARREGDGGRRTPLAQDRVGRDGRSVGDIPVRSVGQD